MSNKVMEIRDVHSIVQKIIDTIEADPADDIQYDKPSLSQGMGIAGHADFRILYHGVWLDIECKADMWLDFPNKLSTAKSRLPTLQQCKQLKRTEAAGGVSLVVDIHTAHEVDDVLSEIKQVVHYLLKQPQPKHLEHLISSMHWQQFASEIKDISL